MKRGYYKTVMMIISLVMFSCHTDALLATEPGLSETSLTGRWEWVSTDGGIAFHIHDTPASTGREEEWVFTEDMKYFKYVNGSLVSEETYSLEKRKCIHDHEEKWLIKFSSASGLMIERVDKQFLDLSDELYDGVGLQFIRIE